MFNARHIVSKLAKNQLFANKLEEAYNWLPYHFGRGKAFHPLSVTLLVSYRCNLRCKMCFYYNEVEKGKTCKLIEDRSSEELTLSQIKDLIDQCAKMKVKVFTIHGGEPLLYPNIFEVSRYARDKGMLVNFVTNGTLINEVMAKKIVNAGINHITFSLDGPRSVHDEVRSVPGTFDRLIKGIGILKDMEAKGAVVPNLSISTYVSAINQKRLAQTLRVINETGIKDWGVGLITHNSDKLAMATKNRLGLDCEDGHGNLEGLKDEVKNINIDILNNQREACSVVNSHQGYSLNIIFPSKDAINNYYNPGWNEISTCTYPWSRTVISPYGEVFPCVNLSMVNCILGNIKEKSLSNIWNDKPYALLRKSLKRDGLLPLCSKCCHINNKRDIAYKCDSTLSRGRSLQ